MFMGRGNVDRFSFVGEEEGQGRGSYDKRGR